MFDSAEVERSDDGIPSRSSDGVPDFRDLGGYLTEDGRRVRWGQVFRSGAFADLASDDLGTVVGLGIKLVCDLRSDSEVAAEADPDVGAEPLRLAVTDESVEVQAITELIVSGQIELLDPNLLRDGMPKIATQFPDSWASMLTRPVRVVRELPDQGFGAGRGRAADPARPTVGGLKTRRFGTSLRCRGTAEP